MLLAADYPFLDVIWTMFIFFLWILWFWLLFTVFADIFRRRDISGLGRPAGSCSASSCRSWGSSST